MPKVGEELFGQDTLVACWEALAKMSAGATVVGVESAVAAVFPSWLPLNNAILLSGAEAALPAGLAGMYADAGVDAWALWMSSSAMDLDAPDDVPDIPGLQRDTTTLVMKAALPAGLRPHHDVVCTSLAVLVRMTEDEPVPVAELEEPDTPPGLEAWVLVRDGLAVCCAWTFLNGADCGVYAVGTLPPWRRQGLARSLMEHVLGHAHDNGARTASLQSTRMGLPLYESLGFEPVGRYEEWTPR
jgi:GNAT superfamily N-acetyltransferase